MCVCVCIRKLVSHTESHTGCSVCVCECVCQKAGQSHRITHRRQNAVMGRDCEASAVPTGTHFFHESPSLKDFTLFLISSNSRGSDVPTLEFLWGCFPFKLQKAQNEVCADGIITVTSETSSLESQPRLLTA